MKRIDLIIIALVLALLIAWPTLAHIAKAAPVATNYDISWFTIDSGVMNVSGGSYSLSGTIGQPFAGSMSSGSYTSSGGFWGGTAGNHNVYLPLVLKNV